ncbi:MULTISPECIES: aminoglycoside phosphotransferase family protein [unclassified Rhizobium]|uniref:aminoglycoside phosphotransferase family protein n=1 Tax=unclassified Rhizobium TaxID=2613769 RepID=UPI001ADABAFE|nr:MULTISPECIES: aminoglycoside phosphotransferase family protein [unclassified Rhizobium]MBO9099631.1 aminoglycoside phosphotransferase family protein [Rhizobium sp. L58/93]QXZ86899.1 aminoglycoside phosphotransferase family protein [Rhizobium sp. K1/93]QXZ93067.1 aminoglycoside phosphotransferase family protein [Rhizobium sp. K15/93]
MMACPASSVDHTEVAAWLGKPLVASPPFAATASPLHHAVDAETRVLRTADEKQLFVLKVWHDDLPQRPDGHAVFAMTQAASSRGVTPIPRLLLGGGRGFVMDHIGDGWTPARLHQLNTEDGLDRLLSAKRALHELAPFPVDRNVFQDIRDLAVKTRPIAARWPQKAEEMVVFASELEQALAASGVDLVPGHADGVSSNVMLRQDGAVQLIDFDEAGNVDPLFDLAVVLNEVFPLDEARQLQVLEAVEGQVSKSSRARIAAYAFADDLKWALWGLFMDASSPRRHLEFLKYGQWRWLRCQMAAAGMNQQELVLNV